MTDTPNDDAIDDDASTTTFPRWLKWGLLGALAILVVGYGLIFLYAKVIRDSPEELGLADLDAALAAESTGDGTGEGTSDGAEPVDDAPATTDAPSASTAPAVTQPETPATTAAPLPDGAAVWNITDASELGYRIKEILFGVDTEAVGRTNQITGSLTIDGTQVTDARFVVDVATIESDDGRRDRQFRDRIMSVDEFPEAVFELTEPIELGTASADGVAVAAIATGNLTLRGVTNPVSFDVTAEQASGRIGVLGNIPVVFADYEIANPSTGGITTEDNGLLEFVLVFEPAG